MDFKGRDWFSTVTEIRTLQSMTDMEKIPGAGSILKCSDEG